MPTLVPAALWLSTLAGLAVAYAGFARRRVALAMLGVALASPLLLYLVGTPRFRWWAVAVLTSNLLSVVLAWKGRPRLAAALFSLLPVFLLVLLALR